MLQEATTRNWLLDLCIKFLLPLLRHHVPSWLIRFYIEAITATLSFCFSVFVTGKSFDSPDTGNVDQMSEKYRKMSRKCLKIVRREWKHNFRTFFWPFLPICSMLLFGDPVQCSPVTTLCSIYNANRRVMFSFKAREGCCCPTFFHKKFSGKLWWSWTIPRVCKPRFRRSNFWMCAFRRCIFRREILGEDSSAKPKGVSKRMGYQNDKFFDFWKLGILVPVLGVSFAAPKGVSKWMGYQNGKCFSKGL